jgi:hypothetical protein
VLQLLSLSANEAQDTAAAAHTGVDLSTLLEMDVVAYRTRDEGPSMLGAVVCHEGNTRLAVHPLCAWTLDSCFAGSDTLELLLDEEEAPMVLPLPTSPLAPVGGGGGGSGDGGGGASAAGLVVTAVLEGVGYGSRVVGGGIGPSNSHGEESEDLYFVERGGLPAGVDVVLRPELEVFW